MAAPFQCRRVPLYSTHLRRARSAPELGKINARQTVVEMVALVVGIVVMALVTIVEKKSCMWTYATKFKTLIQESIITLP